MLYAHKDTKKGTAQLLQEHLQQVGELMCREIAYLAFPTMSLEMVENLLRTVGEGHDTGKGTTYFQDYLDGTISTRKNHAYLSAVIYALRQQEFGLYEYIGFLAILKHHGKMRLDVPTQGQEFSYLPKKYSNWYEQMGCCCPKEQGELPSNLSEEEMKCYAEDVYDLRYSKNISDQWFFILQYVFSKLLWADKMNSSGSEIDESRKLPVVSAVDEYIIQKSRAFDAGKGGRKAALDEDRESIRQEILASIESLSDEEIRQRRVFTVTAPTGSGKTLSSMSAALALGERLRKIYGSVPKIIVALPFINILEQTRADYEALFDQVLVHHGLSDWSAGSNKREGDVSETEPLSRRHLLVNSWESNVVITTFVQFFESIFTGENRRLLKVNKLSQSIVILDEIQALPAKYYGLIGVTIKRISEYYGTRFILMTATKPEIVYFAEELLKNEDLPNKRLVEVENNTVMQTTELLPGHACYYQKLQRTKLVPMMEVMQNEKGIADLVAKNKKRDQSALVVLNTIRRSILTFHQLKSLYQGECEVLYLSTNLISLDRKAVIRRAKHLERQKEPFILVSTQTIEAGVDLDFDIGFRDLAPLESIIQVAGRVNRCGMKGTDIPVYIFDTEDWKKVYGLFYMEHTKNFLSREYRESDYKDLIEGYYSKLKEGMTTDERIYNEGVLKLDYDVIEEFRMIDKEYAVCKILIEKDETVQRLIEELLLLYREGPRDFETKVRINGLLSRMGNYTVEVAMSKLRKGELISFKERYGIDLDLYIVPTENVEQYYDETGYIFDEEEQKKNIFF